jgi:hypothetical protein
MHALVLASQLVFATVSVSTHKPVAGVQAPMMQALVLASQSVFAGVGVSTHLPASQTLLTHASLAAHVKEVSSSHKPLVGLQTSGLHLSAVVHVFSTVTTQIPVVVSQISGTHLLAVLQSESTVHLVVGALVDFADLAPVGALVDFGFPLCLSLRNVINDSTSSRDETI